MGGNVIGGILSENPEFVKKGIEKIDLGGYIECIHQIVGSKKLQEEIRREFVIKKMDEKVVGEKYNFMEETDE